MGGLCSGLVPEAPSIDIPPEEVATMVNEQLAEPAKNYNELVDKLQGKRDECKAETIKEYKYSEEDGCPANYTEKTITKDTTDEEISNFAKAVYFDGKTKEEVTAAVFGALEPTIDEQLGQVDPAPPQMVLDKAKSTFEEKVVAPAVEKAIDKIVEKASQKKGGDEEPAAAAGDEAAAEGGADEAAPAEGGAEAAPAE